MFFFFEREFIQTAKFKTTNGITTAHTFVHQASSVWTDTRSAFNKVQTGDQNKRTGKRTKKKQTNKQITNNGNDGVPPLTTTVGFAVAAAAAAALSIGNMLRDDVM